MKNLVQSFNTQVKIELSSLYLQLSYRVHDKVGQHASQAQNGINEVEGFISTKIEEKIHMNIIKGETLPVSSFMNGIFGIFIWKALLNINIIHNTLVLIRLDK